MALPIQSPGKGGSFIPIAIDLAAASWGQYMLKNLVRFKQGRQGEAPSWDGHGGNINAREVGSPITDVGYWAGWYVLCPVHLYGETKRGGKLLSYADAVVSVNREHRIVSTPLVGAEGTVKEYISAGDWNVEMVIGVQPEEGGAIVDKYPSDELEELMELLGGGKALDVSSKFLEIFGISRMVVKSYRVVQSTDQNYQGVSISGVSDEEYEIYSDEY